MCAGSTYDKSGRSQPTIHGHFIKLCCVVAVHIHKPKQTISCSNMYVYISLPLSDSSCLPFFPYLYLFMSLLSISVSLSPFLSTSLSLSIQVSFSLFFSFALNHDPSSSLMICLLIEVYFVMLVSRLSFGSCCVMP